MSNTAPIIIVRTDGTHVALNPGIELLPDVEVGDAGELYYSTYNHETEEYTNGVIATGCWAQVETLGEVG